MKEELPNNWKWIELQEVADFLRGPFGSSVQKSACVNKGPDTYKLYEQGNVINDDFNRGTYYLTKEKFKELEKFEIKPGDVLITCAGTLGRVAIAPNNIEKGIINSVLMRIRLDKSKILNEYFLYYFRSPQFQNRITSKSFGAAIKNMFATKELRCFKIFLPPIPIQKQIVDKLDKEMAKIEIMKKEAETQLESIEELPSSVLNEVFGKYELPEDKKNVEK